MSLWTRIYHPSPAPPGFGEGKVVPEPHASWWKRLTFGWVSPLLLVGFSRPLQASDLWTLDASRMVTPATDAVLADYERRCSQLDTMLTPEVQAKQRERALLLAWHSVVWKRFWFAGLLKLVSEALTITSPLVTNEFLKFLSKAYIHGQAPFLLPNAPAAGQGFGLAVGLAVMQLVSFLTDNHFQHVIMSIGMMTRSISGAMVFRKSLRISNKARLEHTRGQISTMLSEDTTRLETAVYTIHYAWIAPISLIVGIGLLIKMLKVSALVGLGAIVFSFPVQGILLFSIFSAVKANIRTVDQRVKIMQEVLIGIRSVKMYAWEKFYAHKIAQLRSKELSMVQRFSVGIAGLIAVTTLAPIAATTLSFITYSLLGHILDPATVFSALQLFNIIQLPLLLLPIATSSAVEGQVALARVSKFLAADELPPASYGDTELGNAVNVTGSFTWEADIEEIQALERKAKEEASKTKEQLTAEKMEQAEEKRRLARETRAIEKDRKRRLKAGLPLEEEEDNTLGEKTRAVSPERKQPFQLKDIALHVSRGSFVAIVGRVGSGKSSLLQAISGEMRAMDGIVSLGGPMSLVSQAPWIVNATLRDNIIFNEPIDEDRYQAVVRACALQPDLASLPHGDSTEIGERGINLSGGQKARICLARAMYSKSDMLLLDDPLSAVDANVGRVLVDECLTASSGPMAGRTRILVTHQLHVLPRTERIFFMDNGRIVEEGSYEELSTRRDGAFAKLVEEYGSRHEAQKPRVVASADAEIKDSLPAAMTSLMQEEDRELGQVRFATYSRYFKAAGGVSWMPWILTLILIGEGLHVADQLALGWWSGRTIHNFDTNDYIALYAAVGSGQVIVSFFTAFSVCLASLKAAKTLFDGALDHVMRSPVAFFDTTPLGRIVNRLTKDVNVIDKELSFILFNLLTGVASIFGTVALVFYTFAYLGILFAPLSIIYTVAFLFYRRNSVEVKRLDSVLRSSVFSHFVETLAGISTVRATRQESKFISRVENAMDVQNRAHYMNIAIARWLNMRLNFFASVLILGITLFAAGQRESVNPAKVGIVLTYSIGAMARLADLVAQFAQMEQNLNGVERLLAYGSLPVEGSSGGSDHPPSSWPSGAISFQDVVMAYREGLPDVLRGLNFKISAGQKIGVVGRTGAGKSSIVQVLLRLCEIQGGTIQLDDIDTKTVSLEVLRERISVIPQDSLCLGTVRETIDPLASRTDAELLEILQKAHLLPPPGKENTVAENKFALDAAVGADGSTLSAGERQQLALCRVLVKKSNIVILDEATSSVDVETDAKLQQTIRNELRSSTLLVIAHRLNTVVGFDRVLVMSEGNAAEFDSPLALWEQPTSIFRGLCDEASIDREAIVHMRSLASQ
ncbi:ATP-dependent bile acid permease [Auriculariales sp. MPI-PUGE-AT-0066]|nr:ATP-dependent bile acid permease [Auriculariales sp. MPI-PUGE-AT-0066]